MVKESIVTLSFKSHVLLIQLLDSVDNRRENFYFSFFRYFVFRNTFLIKVKSLVSVCYILVLYFCFFVSFEGII